ncbi:P-loop containing nucleoside triphosphate hydrolase protein, partial [Clavulina sp. PMI_390]
APTSSGKTVLFELSIIKVIKSTGPSKGQLCVYMAPTKALCSERFKDWSRKFGPLGVTCVELTGDTSFSSRMYWKKAEGSTITILFHSSHETSLASQIALFMVDEVHLLHEPRGATLEVCVSRMKTMANPRFIMVSATVPNIKDVADWIRYGDPPHPTAVFTFDESYRPCQISRHVHGFPRKNQNDFQFVTSLDKQIARLVELYAQNQPLVIFCSTRKNTFTVAQIIQEFYQLCVKSKKPLPWRTTAGSDYVLVYPCVAFLTLSILQKNRNSFPLGLCASGIAVHHAGLSASDRAQVEDLFAKKQIMVVVSTSTLAVGVNMPAHTVIIHGTRHWGGSSWEEYSDLDIMQMIGRAGRPQFDNEGVAVILCESSMVSHYKDLLSGRTVLESNLHKHLIEHVASEVNLGTITSTETAKQWLRNSFFFQRIQKNPSHYASVVAKQQPQTWQERLDDIVIDAVATLKDGGMIDVVPRKNGSDVIAITDVGDVMVKLYLRFKTMKAIQALEDLTSIKNAVSLEYHPPPPPPFFFCFSDDVFTFSRFQVYSDLARNPDIRFQLKKVEKTSDKVYILIQAVLGHVPLSAQGLGAQASMEAFVLVKSALRISQAIVEVGIIQRRGSQIRFGAELNRSLSAKAWDDRPVSLVQLPHIGEKSAKVPKVLAANGIHSIALIRSSQPHRLEALLNRKPPFGREIVSAAVALPEYMLKISEDDVRSNAGRDPVKIHLSIDISLRSEPQLKRPNGKKQKGLGMTSFLTVTSENSFIDFRRIPTKNLMQAKKYDIVATLDKPSQTVVVHVHSDNFAGLGLSQTYRPLLPTTEYPTRITRPPQTLSVDVRIAECEAITFIIDIFIFP